MPLTVTLDEGKYRDIELTLSGIRNGSRTAMYSAVQRTAVTAKTRLGRLIRSELNLPAEFAKKLVYVSRRPTKQAPIAAIRISGKLIPLKRFIRDMASQVRSARSKKQKSALIQSWIKREVVATTFKSEGPQRFPHSFVNDRLGGHPFSRQAQRDNRQSGPVSPRLPIHKLYGPSAADAAMKRRGELEAEVRSLGEVLEKNLLSQVDRLLNRRKSER